MNMARSGGMPFGIVGFRDNTHPLTTTQPPPPSIREATPPMAPRRLSKLQQWILFSTLTIGTLTYKEDINLDGFATSRQELLEYRHYQHPT